MIFILRQKKRKRRKECFLCFALLFLHIPIKLVTLPFDATFTKESRPTLSLLFTTHLIIPPTWRRFHHSINLILNQRYPLSS